MLKQSRHATGNLINRYRAVLRACRLCNIFGSLALAAAVLLTAPSPVLAANSGGRVDEDGNYIGTQADPAQGAGVIIDSTVANSVYGGMATTDDAKENSVTLKDSADVTNSVYGGYTGGGNAEDNTVTTTGGTVQGSVSSGYTNHGNAAKNTVTMTGTTVGHYDDSGTSFSTIYGGYTGGGNAAKNTVTVNGGTIRGFVYGGEGTGIGNATLNEVTLYQVREIAYVYGGSVTGGDTMGRDITSTGDATDNIVRVSDSQVQGDVYGGSVYGGSGSFAPATGITKDSNITGTGDAVKNHVAFYSGETSSIYGGSVTGGDVYGDSGTGKITGTGNAMKNNVAVYSGEAVNIYGGSVTGGVTQNDERNGDIETTGAAASNNVTIYDGTVGNVYGGSVTGSYTYISAEHSSIRSTGNAEINHVTIYGGEVGNVYGGTVSGGFVENGRIADDDDGSTDGSSVSGGSGSTNYLTVKDTGDATGNIVELYGGTVTGDVYGGYVSGGYIEDSVLGQITVEGTGDATNNTIRLAGSPNLASAMLYGGYSASGSVDKNTLEVTGTHEVKDVKNFSTYRFTSFSPSQNNTPMLTLLADGGSDISKSHISVDRITVSGSDPALAEGDRFSLIRNEEGLTTEDITSDIPSTVRQGASILYDFSLTASPDDVALQVTSARVDPRSKSLAEGRLAGTVLALQGADLVAGQGMHSALRAVEKAGSYHAAGFGTISGSSLSYDTGSSIDMKSMSLLTGLAWSAPLTPGTFTAGAFFEYGNGSYDTWNSFVNASSVHGDGDA